ncbi:hypothetical protein C5167_038203 [Papaver somniferum]|uniref:DUF620 domain-containing protein n=1 Tax=Papaver somniferum TaxID=3469 RepID=A0A4Y7IB32_PAPSO|nr:uncharacterized protein LOC113294167 [Papaver somniferum]RZC45246.1 hypothetical protein C5167_038203 [Papaver somniferum]
MRKLWPNVDQEDGLDTVLEVPIPDEMFSKTASKDSDIRWQNMRNWVKSQSVNKSSASQQALAGRNAELQLLLNVVGSPLLPLQVQSEKSVNRAIKDCSIQASTAKYIVHTYTAAVGGQQAINGVNSMYAIGQVKMCASEFHMGGDSVALRGNGEIGGFVLWQKSPDLWNLELVVSGSKLSAGSNGKVVWRQFATQQSHASRGPPRPLRRFLQGLDPRSTANLFSDAVCIGERIINNDDCFILKLDASSASLQARSSDTFEIIHHTIWGYFSQKSGLLIQFEDSHLLRMSTKSGEDVFWETSMESMIDDYRYVEGINIAHSGKTVVTLFRYGAGSANHKRKMEETWSIEEVDFNIRGLSMDCFLPPADLKKEDDSEDKQQQSYH